MFIHTGYRVGPCACIAEEQTFKKAQATLCQPRLSPLFTDEKSRTSKNSIRDWSTEVRSRLSKTIVSSQTGVGFLR